jgi:hypothetical protein
MLTIAGHTYTALEVTADFSHDVAVGVDFLRVGGVLNGDNGLPIPQSDDFSFSVEDPTTLSPEFGFLSYTVSGVPGIFSTIAGSVDLVTSIPEPGTLSLISAGLLVMTGRYVHRRRRHRPTG